MPATKTHLLAADQTGRWVGPVLFQPERGFVLTRCGKTSNRDFIRRYTPDWLANQPHQGTCGSCLHSFWVELIGVAMPTASRPAQPQFRRLTALFTELRLDATQGAPRQKVLQALLQRLGSPKPWSPEHWDTARWLLAYYHIDLPPYEPPK